MVKAESYSRSYDRFLDWNLYFKMKPINKKDIPTIVKGIPDNFNNCKIIPTGKKQLPSIMNIL
jgi:hypothetical protein